MRKTRPKKIHTSLSQSIETNPQQNSFIDRGLGSFVASLQENVPSKIHQKIIPQNSPQKKLTSKVPEPASDSLKTSLEIESIAKVNSSPRQRKSPSMDLVDSKKDLKNSCLNSPGPFPSHFNTGLASEHLVCADLIFQGFTAFLTSPEMPYDIAIDHNGRLIRIQVKSRIKPKNIKGRFGSLYTFKIQNSSGSAYKSNAFDILALVAADSRTIAYLPYNETVNGCEVRLPVAGGGNKKGWKKKYKPIDQYPFLEAIKSCV